MRKLHGLSSTKCPSVTSSSVVLCESIPPVMAVSASVLELFKAGVALAVVTVHLCLPSDHFLAPSRVTAIIIGITETISLLHFMAISPFLESVTANLDQKRDRLEAPAVEVATSQIAPMMSRPVRWLCCAFACGILGKTLHVFGSFFGCLLAVVLGSMFRAWLDSVASAEIEQGQSMDDEPEDVSPYISPYTAEFWADLGPVRDPSVEVDEDEI